jgi:Serine dehydrogenase proteinase
VRARGGFDVDGSNGITAVTLNVALNFEKDMTKDVLSGAIVYAGEISIEGYRKLCDVLLQLNNPSGAEVRLILCTVGGNPHAAFRIARALTHVFGKFQVVVPGMCKSAGTLVCLGAHSIVLADRSELGPLDVQVKKREELFDMSSGLDILQALQYLQETSLQAFQRYLFELHGRSRLNTKLASEIASALTTGLMGPLYAQIDPVKLGEMRRAIDIAVEYGERLADSSKNVKKQALAQLVTGYPSHGFVIDRKEARTLFERVEMPTDLLKKSCDDLYDVLMLNADSSSAIVEFYEFEKGEINESEIAAAPSSPNGVNSTRDGANEVIKFGQTASSKSTAQEHTKLVLPR